MLCARFNAAMILVLAFGNASAQLGGAPASGLSTQGNTFGHPLQTPPSPAAATPAHVAPSAVVKPGTDAAAKAGVTTPAQMAKPTPPAQASPPPQAAKQGESPDKRAAAGAAPRITEERLTITSPRRAILMQQQEALRAQSPPVAQAVQRSAGTGIAPGLSAGTAGVRSYASSYTPQTAAGMGSNKLTQPGIVLVNGKQAAVRVTPGGKLVISGYGFGDARGNVSLVGGALDAQPVLLLGGKWRNDEIEAFIPGATRGVPDESGATLKVVTASGAAYRMDGIDFRAGREEITLTGGAAVQKFFDWFVDPSWTPESWMSGNGALGRFASGHDIDCKQPGIDRLQFKTLNGFEVIGATMGHGRTDSGDRDESGNAGSRAFFPGYSFGAWTERPSNSFNYYGTYSSVLEVHWGVFRSHTSPKVIAGATTVGVVPLPYVNANQASDNCSSVYTITSLRLYGPAGVSPL